MNTATISIDQVNVELARLIEDATGKLQAGESLDLDAYARDFPNQIDQFREILPAIEALAGIALAAGPGKDEHLGTTLGDFCIVRELGRGGMGVVYEAEQISLGRLVALKVLPFAAMLDKQQLNRFKNEARSAGTLDHPNIVAVHSVGTERGVHYYAMQLIEGQSLAELIAGLRKSQDATADEADAGDGRTTNYVAKDVHSPQTEPRQTPSADTKRGVQAAISTLPRFDTQEYFRSVAQLGIQTAQALDYAHQNGIVHRDVKPGNLLVDTEGKLWVTDFGLALIEADAGMTMTGDVLGTLRYMSPEQALGKRAVVDHRVDIYSLGATLYELLTLEPVFRGGDREELLKQITFEEPRPPCRINRAIPRDLGTIVLKAIQKNPEERYATVQDLADDLNHFQNDEPIKAKRPTVAARMTKWSRRHKVLVWSAAVILVMLTIGLMVSTAVISQERAKTTKAYQKEKKQRQEAQRQEQLAMEQQRVAIRQRQLAEEQRRLADKQRRLAQESATKAEALRQQAERQREMTETMLLLALQDFRPVGAAFGPDGNFYVGSSNASRILQFHGKSGDFMREFVQAGNGGLDFPQSLIFGPDGNDDGTDDLYVASAGNDAILRYDGATGAFLDAFVSPGTGGLTFPTGLVFGPDGNLYVASFGSRCVLRYDGSTGKFMGAFVTGNSGGLNGPQTLVFGPDKDLYVTSFRTDSVLRYDGTTGDFIDEFVPRGSGGLKRPEGIAFGPDGNLYVAAGYSVGVLRYNGKTGAFIDEFIPLGLGGLLSSQTAIWGRDGNLYITNNGTDSVARYDGTTGKFMDYFVTYDRKRLLGSRSRSPTLDDDIASAYLQLADGEWKQGNDNKAEEAFREAIRLDTKNPSPFQQRGLFYLDKDDRDKASADFAKAIELSSDDRSLDHLYTLAMTVLEGGHDKLYREVCASMLQQFADTENMEAAFWVAWTCVLRPDAVSSPDRVVQLAEKVGDEKPDSFHTITLGAALYRAQQYEQAVKRLSDLANGWEQGADKPTSTSLAYTWYFLAMAHHRLGNHEEARVVFDKATNWTDRVVREHEEGTGRLAWNRLLTLKLFRTEAQVLLDSSSTGKHSETGPQELGQKENTPQLKQKPD